MAGTNKLKPSKPLQGRYDAYKSQNRFVKNAERKLKRHLKKFPDDTVAQAALKSVASKKYRQKPEKHLGWLTKQEGVKSRIANATVIVPGLKVTAGSVSITKESAVAYAQILSLELRSPTLPSWIYDHKQEKYVLKHIGIKKTPVTQTAATAK